ncbi:hypothetical protein R9C00_05120 [Flammeovirgaceae bacterium SG7u.111]|nr:hypothetical protein [Flammeovirgaceae bacterium SG7u.132]WPO36826.1 hypothetical protein R9C00_05120 [Flammeovirgaceae bacterium SG7u.111]
MKILTKSILLLIALFMLTGCPYQSAVPVGDPEQKLMKSLLGKWQKGEEDNNFYVVDKLGKYQYQIEESIFNNELQDFEKAYYQGHITEVKGEKFLSIINQTLDENAGQNYFSIYKLEINSDSEFVLFPVSNYIRENFDESTMLKEFIAQNMHLSFFFGEEETYRKISNP